MLKRERKLARTGHQLRQTVADIDRGAPNNFERLAHAQVVAQSDVILKARKSQSGAKSESLTRSAMRRTIERMFTIGPDYELMGLAQRSISIRQDAQSTQQLLHARFHAIHAKRTSNEKETANRATEKIAFGSLDAGVQLPGS